jgi:hypothetical protein
MRSRTTSFEVGVVAVYLVIAIAALAYFVPGFLALRRAGVFGARTRRVPVQRGGLPRRGRPQISVTAWRPVVCSVGSCEGAGRRLSSEADQNATVEGLMYISP